MAGSTQRAPIADRRHGPEAEVAGSGPDGGDGRCEAADIRMAGLVRTIELEIIPRLVLAHRFDPQAAAAQSGGAAPGVEQVVEFCALTREADVDVLLAYVRRLAQNGVALERIYLDLLAPVARRLGEMWLADECDFTTVTLCLWRLQRLLHELSPSFQVEAEPIAENRRVLLAALPGEQHTFGLFMVGEFFRRAGWDVVDGPAFSGLELTAAVRHEWFAVAGFSLSREQRLGDLQALIRNVRQSSRNRAMGIIVGGVVFAARPDLVAQVGADAGATDGREAVRLAQAMLGGTDLHHSN